MKVSDFVKVGYNKRVAETLARAGHDVTVVLIQTIEGTDKDVAFASDIRGRIARITTKVPLRPSNAPITPFESFPSTLQQV